MNVAYPPPNRTRVMRMVRAYAPNLRDRYPADEKPADELMDLLEQADQRWGDGNAGGCD